MRESDVRIEMDDQHGTYLSGDGLTGRVVFTPTKDLKPTTIVVKQLWQTTGQGNIDKGILGQRHFRSPYHKAGVECAYPFQFAVPFYPLSYSGKLLRVDHYISVKAMGQRKVMRYIVKPRPDSRQGYLAIIRGEKQEPKRMGLIRWLFAPIWIPFAIILLLMFTAVFLISVIFITVIDGCKYIFRSLAERTLGTVRVELTADRLRDPERKNIGLAAKVKARLLAFYNPPEFVVSPNETITVTIRMQPPSIVNVNSITVSILAEEHTRHTWRGSSDSSNRDEHRTEELFASQTELVGVKRLIGGSRTDLTGNIIIPVTKAWSFHTINNSISWKMIVHINVAGALNWSQSFRLVMAPGETGADRGPSF